MGPIPMLLCTKSPFPVLDPTQLWAKSSLAAPRNCKLIGKIKAEKQAKDPKLIGKIKAEKQAKDPKENH